MEVSKKVQDDDAKCGEEQWKAGVFSLGQNVFSGFAPRKLLVSQKCLACVIFWKKNGAQWNFERVAGPHCVAQPMPAKRLHGGTPNENSLLTFFVKR